MDKGALISYFSVDSEEEATDKLEQTLFEIKQHFISRPWLALTAKTRIRTLKELAELEQAPENVTVSLPNITRVETENVLEWWSAYQYFHNQVKHVLMRADKAGELWMIVEYLFREEKHFIMQVPDWEWSEEAPVYGVEPDPMMIQKALVALDSKGIRTFAKLFDTRLECPKELLLAVKRWSGLIKYV